MTLYFGDTALGDVRPTGYENYWDYGEISLFPAAEQFRDFFQVVTDEERGAEDLPDEYVALFESNQWFLVDDSGSRRALDAAPAIQLDGSIAWVRR